MQQEVNAVLNKTQLGRLSARLDGMMEGYEISTLPETNSLPLKIGHPKRKVVFQPYIFRGV